MNDVVAQPGAFRSSPEIGHLAEALAKAQADFPEISRNREVTVRTKAGSEYKFRYATLDTILSCTRRPMADSGLSLTQLIETHDGHVVLKTVLLHSSGQWIMSETPIPVSMGPQEFGSMLSYMRRYAISAILNLASQDDDDGNIAEGNAIETAEMPVGKLLEATRPGLATEKQIKFAWSLAKRLGWTEDDMKAYLKSHHGIESAKEMTKDIASLVIDHLQMEIENRTDNEQEAGA